MRWLPILILAAFRFWDLGARPVHHDEAVNGWFVDGILSRGYYSYDPQNYHGPFFFYLLTLFEKMFGRSVEVMRATTVLAGIAVTASPLLFRKWIGSTSAWIAGAFFALSPAVIFYSRYAIHEMFFALAIILFFYNWLRVREEGFHLRTILGFGLSLGLLAGVKENFVLFGACLGLGELAVWGLERKLPLRLDRRFWLGLASGFGIGFLFIVLCYTAFFLDSEGLSKFFKAFQLWSETGSKGNGHQKPFDYFFGLMAGFEWPALLGLLVSGVYAFWGSSAVRLLAWSSLAHLLSYSLVSYKTPWCMLSFEWGLFLLAAMAFSRFMSDHRRKAQKWLAIGVLVALSVRSGVLAWDVAWAYPDQDGHPYIYGQTYHELTDQTSRILAEVREKPGLKETLRVQVVSAFTWPLPYLLGEIKQTAFFGHENAPPVFDGDWVIFDRNFEQEFLPRMQGNYSRTEVRSRQWAYPMVFFRKN
jgi:uncharacterized protein (TIGR03663 family)